MTLCAKEFGISLRIVYWNTYTLLITLHIVCSTLDQQFVLLTGRFTWLSLNVIIAFTKICRSYGTIRAFCCRSLRLIIADKLVKVYTVLSVIIAIVYWFAIVQGTCEVQNTWRDTDFGIIPTMSVGKGEFMKRVGSNDGTTRNFPSGKTSNEVERM